MFGNAIRNIGLSRSVTMKRSTPKMVENLTSFDQRRLCCSKRVESSCIRVRFLPKSKRPNRERDRKSMRRAWAPILKLISSLNRIGVVKINPSARGSERTVVASGKVAKVARSISKACDGAPACRRFAAAPGRRYPASSRSYWEEGSQSLGSEHRV